MTVTVVLIFAAVFLGTFSLFSALSAFRSSVELKRRLRQMTATSGDPSGAPNRELLPEASTAERLIADLPLMAAVKRQIDLSGVSLTTPRFLLLTCLLSAACFIALLAWKGSVFAALLAALASAWFPFAYLSYRKGQRSKLFDEQLPDVLTMIARSLRAGHSLAAAVELIGQELPDPTGKLFRIAYEQQKLGMRIADSLGSLVGKMESMDFKFFVTIVRINSETGGNLSEILDKLAETIRSRQQIRRQVQVYTAEGRLSGYILVALPVAVFGMFYILRPGYLDVFFTERICQLILGIAVLGQMVGFLVIRKIIDIRI